MGLFSKKFRPFSIHAPVDGTIIKIEEVEDEVFSQKMLGDGFAFKPEADKFYAPFAGTLETVLPMCHAYGIRHRSGVSALLHIGLDTVTLNGEGFKKHVNQNDKITEKALLVQVDRTKIHKKFPNIKLVSPLIFLPDGMANHSIELSVDYGSKVKAGDLIGTIK